MNDCFARISSNSARSSGASARYCSLRSSKGTRIARKHGSFTTAFNRELGAGRRLASFRREFYPPVFPLRRLETLAQKTKKRVGHAAVGTLMRTKSLLAAALKVWELKQRGLGR